MKKLLCMVLMSFAGTTWADDLSFTNSSYKEAEQSKNYLRFDMKSTKLGLITTSFTGFVKKFDVSYTPTDSGFTNVQVRWAAKSMDTDVSARNEKMWDYCFESDKYVDVAVSLPGPIAPGENVVNGTIRVRGIEKPFRAKVTVEQSEASLRATGKAELSLKDLEIPDPSIVIAKVKDQIEVSFSFGK